ncbi:FIST N-terminal domain-containing protein [Sulfurovum sp.]|uniref:FIST N-terminal domain-containing protein n=1 Tax=Sulfurovum sp. TaxID=1969726 RepID=UPI002605D273|nr:FIST N-terminal domain-containing protein [Sulfurovum sp.]
MKQIAVTSVSLDTIDFIPTVIIGFYRKSEKTLFSAEYQILKKRFPQADIIGCSSAGNIANELPYIESRHQFPCVYLCLKMDKEAFTVEVFHKDDKITPTLDKEKKYQVILFSAFTSFELEDMLSPLPSVVGTQRIFGAVAGVDAPAMEEEAEVFYNGVFYDRHVLLWMIDESRYRIDGMSMHLFRPAGLPLKITSAKGNKIYELNNQPAMEVLEALAGELDESAIGTFAYPLFLQKEAEGHWESAPLASMIGINRKDKSILLYRSVCNNKYVKLGIMVSQQDQLKRLRRLYSFAPPKSAALLFNCIGIEKNLSMMEYLYLEDVKRHLDITFVGGHTFGEIGPPATSKKHSGTVLHNQTMTIALIAEREVSS